MSGILPINIDDLLHFRGIESERVEFKASWDENNTGYQVLKTICAFANDLHNLNGGYIIVGVAEQNHVPVLPPKGLNEKEIETAEKWIRGNCNRIDPTYQPVFSPEKVDEKWILVVWVPGSDTRPHKAPDGPKSERKFWVRIGSESVDAEKNGVLTQLMELTARVPFDSRRANHALVDDLRESKVREFLRDIRSSLLEEADIKEVYRRMRITQPVNSHECPINVGLLFFSDDIKKWFAGAHIEVVQFADDLAGDVQEEKVFRGPLHEQIKDALQYLENLATSHIEKQKSDFRVRGWISYPIPALREALVNAIYHRSYEHSSEPVKVYLYPDRMEIISYPGPVRGIERRHLEPDQPIPPVPARNRRVGEFLKELRLAEGRGTGLPKIYKSMRENGSPRPKFDFDEGRTYFRATLPAHPEYLAISAMRDAAHLRALGDNKAAIERLEDAWKANPSSATITAEIIRNYAFSKDVIKAEDIYKQYKKFSDPSFLPHVTNAMIDLFFEAGRIEEAKKLLDQLPAMLSASDAFDAAILARRLKRQESAHRYFERAGDAVFHDVRALHEFAQTKIYLANKAWRDQRSSRKFRKETNLRLLSESKELLERVLQLDAPNARHAWAWRDLGRVKRWLKYPRSEVIQAFKTAIDLLPGENLFKEELERYERVYHRD